MPSTVMISFNPIAGRENRRSLATVKEIMRHKTIEMTLRYSHLAPAHKKAAVEALAKSLAGSTEDVKKAAKSV